MMNAFTQEAPDLFIGALTAAAAQSSLTARHPGTLTIQELRSDLADAQRSLQVSHMVKQKTDAWIDRLRAGDAESPGGDFDTIIALLLSVEQNGADIRSASQKRLKDLASRWKHHPPMWRLMKQTMFCLDDAMRVLIRAARDMRWEMMAVRAAASPVPGSDCPTLASVDDVDRWFASLPSEAGCA